MEVKQKGKFITIKDGKFKVVLCSIGASIFDIKLHGKHMVMNVRNKDEHVENGTIYFGKTAGRICGRVPQCKLVYHGAIYDMDKNDGNNSLHGGKGGISTRDFDSIIEENENYIKVTYSYFSKDKEEGYPGNVEIKVIYTVKKDNFVLIEFESTSDVDTPIDLTNHAYYNLGGSKTILEHHFQGNVEGVYESTNETLIDTKKFHPLPGVDALKGFKMGDMIYQPFFQDFFQHGIDHCFKFFEDGEHVINLSSEKFSLELKTDYPCFQIYSENYANLKGRLNNWNKDCVYAAMAIEPQEVPVDFEGMTSKANETKHRWMSIQFKEN